MHAKTFFHRPTLLCLIFSAALTVALSKNGYAQYFGRNKVQYKTFDYKVLTTEHFTIYFYPEEKQAVDQAARMAERWYARYAQVFEHKLNGTQPLILYASHPEFEQTNAIPGELGEGTGGVTEPIRRRIVLPFAGPLAETDHVIGHELVHAFQFDITTSRGQQGGGVPGAERLPLWFIEGMAEYLSLGPVDPNTAMWLRDAARLDKLPTIRQLNDPKYFPYRWGQAFWAYVTGRWGDESVADLLRSAGRTGDLEGALRRVLGISADQLSKDWHQAIHAAYDPIAAETRPAAEFGKLLISGKGFASGLNVSPALSPDGSKLVFFSERGLFSIDLYLADARTGKVIRRITKTALDPHFSSLQFINSAGAWSADGRRFAFAAVTDGRPELVVLDVDRDRTEDEIRLPSLGEVFSPTWAPDGHAIAFSAIAGGLTDLFVYDLQTKKLRRMTEDPFADLQPAWSPDGRSIVFVTDRFSTRLTDLDTGNYRLALMDATSGEIRPVRGFDDAKNINPQWSRDGNTLFFVSDHGGISNVYRLDLSGSEPAAITNLFTGVSGITQLSPAMSAASSASLLAYSVYEEGNYNIYTRDPGAPAAVSGRRADAPLASILPPVNRTGGEIVALLRNQRVGLPDTVNFPVDDYHAKLSLDYAAQPEFTAGVDPFGTYLGGGIGLVFSDMLDNYSLTTAFQVSTGITGAFKDIYKDSAGIVAFQNLKHRWNWGADVEQYPYTTGQFQSGFATLNGTPVEVQQTTIFRQINRGASLIASYPFNRVQRVEFSGGYRNISFDREVLTQAFSLDTGQELVNDTESAPVASALNLGQASAALVYDNSYYGATSPILGQRYRLEVSPTMGSIFFNSVLADYRRYFMPATLYTVAARVLHYGRYGRDSEDLRLAPVYLGYPSLVRGYDINSFDASECHATASSLCPEFDRLLGSRLAVANLEFRFPLLRPFGLREGVYGPLPVEVAAFTDAGVAWNSGEKPEFAGGTRKPVSSAGIALRVNAFGYAVAQFDFVRPFQRPEKGWVFQFSLTPGF